MDLQHGTFLQWPLNGDWEANEPLLEMMSITWQTWQFWIHTQNPQYKWTEADINFDTWLEDGRVYETPLSEYEQWLMSANSD